VTTIVVQSENDFCILYWEIGYRRQGDQIDNIFAFDKIMYSSSPYFWAALVRG
jgi:hypothetical protein